MADLFSQAVALHRAGLLDEAESVYHTIISTCPGHADALSLLGVIAHQRGQPHQAVEWLRRAIALQGDRPAYHLNLARALVALNRLDEAIACCRLAKRLQPNEPEVYLSLGRALHDARYWTEAEHTWEEFRQRWPTDARGPSSLADCLQLQGRTAEAVGAYRQALALSPDDGAAHLAAGTLLLSTDDLAGAESHLRQATELQPDLPAAWINLGTCRLRLERPREALDAYLRAQQLAPGTPTLGVNIGLALVGCGQIPEALHCFDQVLQMAPDNVFALCGRAEALRQLDEPAEAIALYTRALTLRPEYSTYRALGDALWELGAADRATATRREAAGRFPEHADAHIELGLALASLGEFEGAATAYRAALGLCPGQPRALGELARILGGQLPENDYHAVCAAIDQPAATPDRAALHFGLAHVEDARGNHDQAAWHLRQANMLLFEDAGIRGQGHDPDSAAKYVDRLISTFSASRFEQTHGFGHPGDQPVFVFGMPRSGTTLVEQILASHGAVFGAGELRFGSRSLERLPTVMGARCDALDCVRQLTAAAARASAEWYLQRVALATGSDARRIVDKMPENYFALGWLQILFPRAHFVHCRRDLRDIALSCWMTNFSASHWSNDLHHIARRIRDYQRVMDHWRSVLPVTFLEIDYERLVTDPEVQSRRLIDWLGLEWDPRCLEYYRTRRVVFTASMTQVRRPIYTRSIGRWRNYVKALQPLLDELGLERE
jgi:tetratricopeptide (TPR) repeat protein